MGLYKYIKDLWKNPKKNMGEAYHQHLIQWRKEPSTSRLSYPTRVDRARELGYKAKQGYFIVRQRVSRGGSLNKKPAGGRRSKNFSRSMTLHLNAQSIAERRANRVYKNCEVLNSYWVGEDGDNKWYEIIFVDRTHPNIYKDPKMNWISLARGRAYRGKTSANRKSRGLRKKGVGTEKVRPSKKANSGRLH